MKFYCGQRYKMIDLTLGDKPEIYLIAVIDYDRLGLISRDGGSWHFGGFKLQRDKNGQYISDKQLRNESVYDYKYGRDYKLVPYKGKM